MPRYSAYLLALIGVIGILPARAKAQAAAPGERQMYCSGIATKQPIRHDTYVISGSHSEVQIVFSQGDKVFINKGARQGVKVGDQLLVSREESDYLPFPWFEGQQDLTRALGTFYADIGRLRVVAVQDRTAIAEVTLACDALQRGDVVQPFFERPAPAFKLEPLDPYAPPSGKARGVIVFSNQFGQVAGAGKLMYINLGTGKGVKVGDYLRIFRYQGDLRETTFNVSGMQDSTFGLGNTPVPYSSAQLPRDILGEGLVLRVSPTSATVMITASPWAIHVGDYVELE